MTAPAAPVALPDSLLHAAAAGDYDRLVELCVAHAPEIDAQFKQWITPGPADLADPASWETRIGGLYAVAKLFANHLANSDLLKAMLDEAQSTEIAAWERRLAESMQFIAALRFDDAVALLANQLIDARRLAGHGHLHLQATTHWYLSQANWLRVDRDASIGHGERALQITQRINDDPKYLARYLQHLYQIYRYFGEPLRAADYAQASAELLAGEDDERAKFFRTEARLLRAPGGQPPVRVVCWVDKTRYEVDEVAGLPPETGKELKLALERNRVAIQLAAQLVRQGVAARNAGKFDEALGLFRQARKIDPHDPEPIMHEGFLLASAERTIEAAERFEEVNRIAPGWPASRTALWMTNKALAGEYPPEILLLATGVGSHGEKPDERLATVRQLIVRFPQLAILRLEEGQLLRAAGDVAGAEASFRRGLRADGDDDVRSRLLLELAQTKEGGERTELLRQVIALDGNLVATAAAKLMVRRPSQT